MRKYAILAALMASLFTLSGTHHENVTHAEEARTGKSEYPHYLTAIPSGYDPTSEDAAFRAAESKLGKIRKGKRERATRGPCPDKKGGKHVNLRYADKGGERAGSLVGCPICRDASGDPDVYWRWKVVD